MPETTLIDTLLTQARQQLALGDADWRKFFLEGQLFAAAIYFVACFAMSRYSQRLERELTHTHSR